MAARPVMHEIDAKPVRVSAILGGDIRLEASTYLREGYGLTRLAKQVPGHATLGELADIWQPGRLTGYTVPEGKGLPFLTAGQVFEDFPRVRKWLAKPFVPQLESRYVSQDWLLLTCSGVVGNVTAVYPHHLNTVITHDLLRIVPKDSAEYGWLYAYMKTDFFTQIARAAQYGHMIKHIEVTHASAFPVIMPEEAVRREIGNVATEAIRLRTRGWELRDEAFKLLEEHVGWNQEKMRNKDSDIAMQAVSASQILPMRVRLDASTYCGDVNRAEEALQKFTQDTIESVTKSIYLPSRFARVYGEGGVPFVTPSDLFDVNAKPTKRIYAKLVSSRDQFILRSGELLMVRSGQKYGLLGRVMVLNDNHDGLFGSDDPIRIVPDDTKMRAGYLATFLNDPVLGRPLVVRLAYGTSIPHLDPGDIRKLCIPRLGEGNEAAIADLMDESVRLSAEADRMENEAISRAQEQIDASIGASSSQARRGR